MWWTRPGFRRACSQLGRRPGKQDVQAAPVRQDQVSFCLGLPPVPRRTRLLVHARAGSCGTGGSLGRSLDDTSFPGHSPSICSVGVTLSGRDEEFIRRVPACHNTTGTVVVNSLGSPQSGRRNPRIPLLPGFRRVPVTNRSPIVMDRSRCRNTASLRCSAGCLAVRERSGMAKPRSGPPGGVSSAYDCIYAAVDLPCSRPNVGWEGPRRMEPWQSNRPCPRCGSLASSTRMHQKGTVRCHLREHSRDHMHRLCLDCRHEWAEAPSEARAPTRLSA